MKNMFCGRIPTFMNFQGLLTGKREAKYTLLTFKLISQKLSDNEKA